MRKFTAEDFSDVRFHHVDDNITRERFAQKINALLEAEREKAPVIEGNMRDGKFWQVMFCPSEHTHTARLVDIREVGE